MELASAKGLILQVGHLERFNPRSDASKISFKNPDSSSVIDWRRSSSAVPMSMWSWIS